MKIEFEVPEKYEEIVKLLASAFEKDVNAFARGEFLACLSTDLDCACDEGRIDDNTHEKLAPLAVEASKI